MDVILPPRYRDKANMVAAILLNDKATKTKCKKYTIDCW